MKQKLIKKVLMCEPLYFDSLDYVINPWMTPGKINKEKTLNEWEQLVKAYEEQNITVEVIKQNRDCPDMVFATDQGIIRGKKVLLSRFWHDERKPETEYYKEWFEKNGYSLNYLPNDVYLEGNGDAFFWKDKLLIGIGYRADKTSCDVISKLFDIEVIPLEIIDHKLLLSTSVFQFMVF